MKKATILVVKDDIDSLNMLNLALGGKGYEVILAKDGNECMAAFRKRKIDLMLLDVHLPDTTGIALLDKIRSQKEHANTKIIVFTAQALDKDEKMKYIKKGAVSVLRKPIPLDELAAEVKKAMEDAKYDGDKIHDTGDRR